MPASFVSHILRLLAKAARLDSICSLRTKRWKAQRRTLVELWLDHLWVVAKGALEDVGTAVGGDVCGMVGDGDGDHCRPKG